MAFPTSKLKSVKMSRSFAHGTPPIARTGGRSTALGRGTFVVDVVVEANGWTGSGGCFAFGGGWMGIVSNAVIAFG